ncbi:hypothetical protein D9M72_137440 [compost metagenome]
MANKHNLKAGDTLFLVWNKQYSGPAKTKTVTITRVGRAYAYWGLGRSTDEIVSLEDLRFGVGGKGYGYSGQAYLSEEHYARGVARNQAWRKFVAEIGARDFTRALNALTIENIVAAAAELGIPAEKILNS